MRGFSKLSLVFVMAACGGEDEDDAPFTDQGGTLDVPGCDYTLNTRIGADVPRIAGDKVGSDPTVRLVHLGIADDPRTSIVAQWRTADETTTAGGIRYGVGEGLSPSQLKETVKGIHFGYSATGSEIYRVHQAYVCGLEPGTTYSYQVGQGKHWSPVYTFHTAPDVEANPDAEVVFGYIGDSRGGYDVWATMAAQMKTRSPDLILFSGDAVTIGLTQYEWETFLESAEPLFATTPVVLTNGNHEANAVNFFSQFAMPGDQENFGFSYGFARVFVANDSPEDVNALATTIPTLIDADFTENASARWKLLMHHRPMWSSGSRHGSNVQLQDAWGPIVDKHHLDLVLNGHEHQYEMSKPLFNKQPVATNDMGTVYVVAGGAGAELYGFNPVGTWSAYNEESHVAALVRVRRTMLTLEPFRDDGSAVPNGFSKTKP